MDRSQIEALLNEVQTNQTSVPDALKRLKDLPFEDLGFAKLDHHRALRTGMPEVSAERLMKCNASKGTSSRRSRSAASFTGTTARR